MARPATRSDEHQIESEIEPSKVRPCAQKGFGGARYTTALAWSERRRRDAEFISRLDLDNRKHPAAPGNDVDLSRRAAPASHDYSPAAHPQMPKAKPLREPSATLGPPASREIALPRPPHGCRSRISNARR